MDQIYKDKKHSEGLYRSADREGKGFSDETYERVYKINEKTLQNIKKFEQGRTDFFDINMRNPLFAIADKEIIFGNGEITLSRE